MTGTVVLPLPLKLPKGVRKTWMTRGSPGGKFGNMLQLLWPSWPAGGQAFGFSLPRTRRFRPLGTWFVAWPVWTATHGQGCGEPHSALTLFGHTVPRFLVYVGRQPYASSW